MIVNSARTTHLIPEPALQAPQNARIVPTVCCRLLALILKKTAYKSALVACGLLMGSRLVPHVVQEHRRRRALNLLLIVRLAAQEPFPVSKARPSATSAPLGHGALQQGKQVASNVQLGHFGLSLEPRASQLAYLVPRGHFLLLVQLLVQSAP